MGVVDSSSCPDWGMRDQAFGHVFSCPANPTCVTTLNLRGMAVKVARYFFLPFLSPIYHIFYGLRLNRYLYSICRRGTVNIIITYSVALSMRHTFYSTATSYGLIKNTRDATESVVLVMQHTFYSIATPHESLIKNTRDVTDTVSLVMRNAS